MRQVDECGSMLALGSPLCVLTRPPTMPHRCEITTAVGVASLTIKSIGSHPSRNNSTTDLSSAYSPPGVTAVSIISYVYAARTNLGSAGKRPVLQHTAKCSFGGG